MNLLNRLRADRDESLAFDRAKPVRELLELLSEDLARADVVISESRPLIPKALKLLGEAEKRWRSHESDPQNLREAIRDFNDACFIAQRECANLATLETTVNRLRNMTNDQLGPYQIQVIAHDYKMWLGSLSGISAILKDLPARLNTLQKIISEIVQREAERQPPLQALLQTVTVVAPAPFEFNETIDKFDSRS